MDISTILSQIDLGSYAMPIFQRGYVWNRDQVRKLMNSLYRGYPIGELLVWDTATDPTISRGNMDLTPGHVNLILDGQQRITSLYGIIRGEPPKFFDGNANAFTGLYFNLDDEIFEFYLAAKMKNNPAWISVTEIMKDGASSFFQKKIEEDPAHTLFWASNMSKLNQLDAIKKQDIHIQTVSGPDKTIDVVVEIFNNVNSGGTKLSKGDLALAKICAEWPDARHEMKTILKKYKDAGYDFSMDWLLRCVTVYKTGQPYFTALGPVSSVEFQKALAQTDQLIGICLDHIGARLGLDHGRVLGGPFAICTMIGYICHAGGRISNHKEWDQLLYWYVHSFLWGRYTGSTESVLAQDLNTIANGEGIEGLIRQLRLVRGDLRIKPEDFWGWSTGARFYPLLYMLTRTSHARDWGTNLELTDHMLGKNLSLNVHHIFPKDVLYKESQLNKAMVNALANYVFLTQDTNLAISNRKPEDYFPEYRAKSPGAMDTHWIPSDPELWKLENYEKFLEERRILLAKAVNKILDSLYQGVLEGEAIENYSSCQRHMNSETEDDEITLLSHWMVEHGLPEGYINFKLCDDCGHEVAIIDLAWPEGIQSGLSQPVALLLDESGDVKDTVVKEGYRYFTNVAELKEFVNNDYL
ncbi:MAG: DUF262 domain-containing protein [Oscillospiraceae bacterium]|nr:DUF262 domain-containing protein [Oscillospiraceae bacterium]